MSAAALGAVPAPGRGPVPWLRLGWVAWRRQRTMLLSTLAVLGGISVYLVVTDFQMRSAWTSVQACRPQQSQVCNFAWNNFQQNYSTPGIISAVLVFAPLLVGAFAGAPLIGRELETGTFRYAWTQGVSRVRWAIGLILAGAIAVGALTGAFGALITWHNQPLVQAQVMPRLKGDIFPTTGVAVIGWGLAAYALGVLGGLLLRRVVPALVSALVVIIGLDYLASRFRLDYLPAQTTTSLQYVPGSQILNQWWEKAGAVVNSNQLNAALQRAGLGQIDISGGKTSVAAQPGQGMDPVTYLLHHGYVQWTSFQPPGRYWTFQWIEFGWLTLGATAILIACIALLRRADA